MSRGDSCGAVPLRFYDCDGIAPSRRRTRARLAFGSTDPRHLVAVFRPCFTAPVWNRVLVLVAGAVLAPGKRTVTQVLRVMGLADDRHFRRYHESSAGHVGMGVPSRGGCCSTLLSGCCRTATW